MDSRLFDSKLNCVCGNIVLFEKIGEIECDWGEHEVIQCPNCEELFSIDLSCPAFQNLMLLIEKNRSLFSLDDEKEYNANSHPC